MARTNSSSFACIASLSRAWVFWVGNTITKVMMLETVFITRCHVSEKWKTGPDTPQQITKAVAATKATGGRLAWRLDWKTPRIFFDVQGVPSGGCKLDYPHVQRCALVLT